MRQVKKIKLLDYELGDGIIRVQSMLNARADDIEGNIRQAKELEAAGCEIIRVSVPDKDAVQLIPKIKEAVNIPLVADIHFDYRLAVMSAEAGADKIRINPGNIGSDEKVKAVTDICNKKGIPIRVGINSGSLEKDILSEFGAPTAKALAKSALNNIKRLENFDFYNIVLSIKSSDVKTMIDSYRIAAASCDYPLHLGVTEAGLEYMGILKNAIGIGSLVTDGIGDTIRVSLTDDPVKEVKAGFDILKAAGVRKIGAEIVSCPTCGRTQINLLKLAKDVEDSLSDCKKNIKVAVMGCVVNGPGEAKEADIGVAGGKDCGVIFKKGEIVKTVSEDKILKTLLEEIDKL